MKKQSRHASRQRRAGQHRQTRWVGVNHEQFTSQDRIDELPICLDEVGLLDPGDLVVGPRRVGGSRSLHREIRARENAASRRRRQLLKAVILRCGSGPDEPLQLDRTAGLKDRVVLLALLEDIDRFAEHLVCSDCRE